MDNKRLEETKKQIDSWYVATKPEEACGLSDAGRRTKQKSHAQYSSPSLISSSFPVEEWHHFAPRRINCEYRQL